MELKQTYRQLRLMDMELGGAGVLLFGSLLHAALDVAALEGLHRPHMYRF
jgi:hypothetical protein